MNISNARLRCLVTALAICGMCVVLNRPGYSAEPADAGDDQGVEVQTRGPVHEAFAGVVAFNPEPGVIVPKTPPANIEEVPPDQKPDGDNVAWIPGYWAWDDERHDFLWISGVWRALPPGRQWLPGYWAQTGQGSQWISGYWADSKATETTYLPAPPTTIERGPNIDPPTPDSFWTPGCWVWSSSRYAWRPGYWVVGQPDWNWCPAYYTWTPRGYVFVDGYWDYPCERRGVLFAPVYFAPGVYGRHGYYYSPSVVINLAVFPDHLFVRPSYGHYYFGDYYGASYSHGGFYASFSYQTHRYGYDPIYAHRSWEHRSDHGWDRQVATSYQYRRDHVDARPPRTWAAENKLSPSVQTKDRSLAVAASFDQYSKRKDSPVHYQAVPKDEKQQIIQRSQEIHETRNDRRTLESTAGGDTPKGKSGKQYQPTSANAPKSPIASQPYEQSKREQPTVAPQPVTRKEHNVEVIRGTPPVDSGGNKSYRQPDPPKSDYRDKPVYSPAPAKAPAEQQPVRHEQQQQQQQPQAPQPSKRDYKSEPAPSGKDQPHDGGKGEGRGEGKGEEQPGK